MSRDPGCVTKMPDIKLDLERCPKYMEWMGKFKTVLFDPLKERMYMFAKFWYERILETLTYDKIESRHFEKATFYFPR